MNEDFFFKFNRSNKNPRNSNRKICEKFRRDSKESRPNSDVRRLLVVRDMNHRFRAVAASHAVVGDTMKGVGIFGFKSRSVVLRGLFWGEGELQALGLCRAGKEPMVPGF
uniref:T1.5 protein n=1 Tax=Malus x robusta TaxID=1184610 RepID=I7IG66_9ROSA|nr:T1.5 [Malus x robusta]